MCEKLTSKNIRVKITMEQIFENGERDCTETETVARIKHETDKLRVALDENREMTFELGKTLPYPCFVDGYEFLLYITTDKLSQAENEIVVEYRVAADLNNGAVSNNKLKLELKTL